MKGVIWLAIPVMLAGCDLVQDRYRMEFRDGSWREIATSPFSNEARWREGCATGEIQVDMTLPLKRGKVVNGREQLLIGGELFELEDARLYRGNGMVLGQAPDHIQRGLKGLDVCRTLRPDRGALPKLKGKGFGD
ncbi:hypothetical protein F3X87_01320 [Aeromonas caviae]|uniref:hypothetical protein n=1 Tax=Aeromonas caviae TaxID=648 RepID=UPI001245EB55|nr:hypothetical protein [Aeromonas caviae]KAB0684324.1 hypothetical protein F3X87_01320 [Aeromonas caviae]